MDVICRVRKTRCATQGAWTYVRVFAGSQLLLSASRHDPPKPASGYDPPKRGIRFPASLHVECHTSWRDHGARNDGLLLKSGSYLMLCEQIWS